MRPARNLCCGTSDGKLLLLDPRTYKTEHAISAHSGTISDMDVSGHTIVTCGFSKR